MIEARVSQLVQEKISDRPDLFLVKVTFHPNGKLIILVDGDKGITIQDCAAISRHVGFHLEEEQVIDQAYNIEVSSPGIDHPLVLPRQYDKNVGRMVRLKLTTGDTVEGKLLAMAAEKIKIEKTVKEKGKKASLEEAVFPLETVKETKVLISFK